MGAVYEARHEAIGRRFAIKFMHADLALNASILARFEREAQSAGSLESENIAAVTDFGRAPDGAPYIVMEFLQGEDLSRLLGRNGPLPVPRVANLVIQACRGLEAAHAAGIVHRDLKPENLFVVRRGDGTDLVKVLDFGIAKLRRGNDAGSATKTGTALGTPFYMPPEQARGEKELDHRADVYALGVILYETLSGQKPHQGDGYNAILYKILTQTPARLETLRSNLPAGLADVVHRAMAGEPAARYADVRELMAALSPFAGATPAPVEHAAGVTALGGGSTPTVATPPDALARPGAAITAQTSPATSLDAASERKPSSKRWAVWLALAAALVIAATWAVTPSTRAITDAPDTASQPAPGPPKAAAEAQVVAAEPAAPPTAIASTEPTPGRPTDTASAASASKVQAARATAVPQNPKLFPPKHARPNPAAALAPNSQRDPLAP